MRADQRAARRRVASAAVARAARGSDPRRPAPGSRRRASRLRLRAPAPPRERANRRRGRARSTPASRSTHSRRAAATATPSSAASRSSASSQCVLRAPSSSRRLRPRNARSKADDARAVIGVDRQHQPVEKTAPLARRTDEQPVHRRRQPDEAHVIGEGARRGDRRAVDAVEPLGRPVAVARLEADAELMDRAVVLDLDRDREAAGAADPRAGRKLGAAQAAAGREQRQRLEQIGLAGAVLAAEARPARLRAPGRARA